MCESTNIQTRKLLGLPESRTVKKSDPDDIESIFGLLGGAEIGVTTKKGGKAAAASAKKNRAKVKPELVADIDAEASSIVISDDEEEYVPPGTKSRPKGKSNKKDALLAPKAPNSRERRREIEQRKSERKRKTEEKPAPMVSKRVKREKTVVCNICYVEFETVQAQTSHVRIHKPSISKYGCSGCCESFDTQAACREHHKQHDETRLPYTCNSCGECFQAFRPFDDHVSLCTLPYFDTVTIVDNIVCGKCNGEFETKNLYDWHKCFIDDNMSCPKCARKFIKRAFLFKHIFTCKKTPPLDPSQVVVNIPSKKAAARPTRATLPMAQIKQEPVESPQSPVTDSDDRLEGFDGLEAVIETHFGDDGNDSEPEEPPIAPATLMPCRVKLEPLDVSLLARHSAPGPSRPQPAEKPPTEISHSESPPQTALPLIRIKKEVINPEYREPVFDPELARNIKREREWGSNAHEGEPKKVYKKPALLALKIKQERMQRREPSQESRTGLDSNVRVMATVRRGHSSSGQFPMISNVLDANTLAAAAAEGAIPPVVPFIPIRIKSEFRVPPPAPAVADDAMEAEPRDAPELALPLAISNVVSLTSVEPMETPAEAVDHANAMEKLTEEVEVAPAVRTDEALKEDSSNDTEERLVNENEAVAAEKCDEAEQSEANVTDTESLATGDSNEPTSEMSDGKDVESAPVNVPTIASDGKENLTEERSGEDNLAEEDASEENADKENVIEQDIVPDNVIEEIKENKGENDGAEVNEDDREMPEETEPQEETLLPNLPKTPLEDIDAPIVTEPDKGPQNNKPNDDSNDSAEAEKDKEGEIEEQQSEEKEIEGEAVEYEAPSPADEAKEILGTEVNGYDAAPVEGQIVSLNEEKFVDELIKDIQSPCQFGESADQLSEDFMLEALDGLSQEITEREEEELLREIDDLPCENGTNAASMPSCEQNSEDF